MDYPMPMRTPLRTPVLMLTVTATYMSTLHSPLSHALKPTPLPARCLLPGFLPLHRLTLHASTRSLSAARAAASLHARVGGCMLRRARRGERDRRRAHRRPHRRD
eukprot:5784200-Pleurochrysis_carterae.AAC.2